MVLALDDGAKKVVAKSEGEMFYPYIVHDRQDLGVSRIVRELQGFRRETSKDGGWAMLAACVLAILTASVGVGSFLFHTLANSWSLIADILPIAVVIYSFFYLALARFLRLIAAVAGLSTVAVRAAPACRRGHCLRRHLDVPDAGCALLRVLAAAERVGAGSRLGGVTATA
ncbi:hypothetical protein [Sinorhizobium fredii]|uniref:Uncharacterized protein n=1 Tax=Rhizobium fredii TaxID=380 RepID=A0A2A6LTB7_RHIFR|nr:hypothetical protein [Sinorhizobium fredii]PDT45635.1 hypothetical protein CO661_22070 [Sinorhizobium fredii]